MKAAISIAALAMPVVLQAVQAQDGAMGAQAVEELRRIGDAIVSLDRGTWLAFWGSFLIGIAVVIAAIVSSWRYARHLSRQVRQASDHFGKVEKDLKVRKRPRLYWTWCTVEDIPNSGRMPKKQLISIAIANVGDVSATGLSGHMVAGMAESPEGLEGIKGITTQMGAMLPRAARRHIIPVHSREGEDAGTGRCFRFKITLWYGGAGGDRYEYRLVGELVGNKVRIEEPNETARA